MKSIPQIRRALGTIPSPPSKSYTNRAILLAALASGTTTVTRALDSDDSRFMLDAIRKIGFDVSGSFGSAIQIGERISMSANDVTLFVGNAGTAMRFLTGTLSMIPGRFILDGDRRMRERPIGDLVDALRTIDAEIEYLGVEGFPPLQIRGKKMRGGSEIAIASSLSSQFASAVMMAGTTLARGLLVRTGPVVSRSYIDVTSDIVKSFGGTIEQLADDRFKVHPAVLRCEHYAIEGDFSSASYWFAAAAAAGGSVTVENLRAESPQGDRQFLSVLEAMGCVIRWNGTSVTVDAPETLRGGTFDCNVMPDIVPTLAAIAPLASEPVVIENVAHLKIKESDRIAAATSELRKLGADVDESEDGLVIHPGWNRDPAIIDPHGDHRIAMSFAVAGLARGNVSIDDEGVVAKSYPGFWKALDSLVASSA